MIPAPLRYTVSPTMPPVSHDPDQLLVQLEAAKNHFGPGHAALVAQLLSRLSKLQLANPRQLIRFHEALLFLRAFPHAASLVPRVEHLLNTFHQRIAKIRAANVDMSLFDDFETSGIAGTVMQDTLSFDAAHWLAHRIPHNIEIAWSDYWDDYQAERSRTNTWPRFIPLLEEDAEVEANIPWQTGSTLPADARNPLLWLLTNSKNFRFLLNNAPNFTIHSVSRCAGSSKTLNSPAPAIGIVPAASISITPHSSSAAKFLSPTNCPSPLPSWRSSPQPPENPS